MPHYKDGTEAKVGDQVFGKLYNTPGVRAGTIISITPGAESCNAMVGFLVADGYDAIYIQRNQLPNSPTRMTVYSEDDVIHRVPRQRMVRGEHHGADGKSFAIVECADYCAVNELTKIGPE